MMALSSMVALAAVLAAPAGSTREGPDSTEVTLELVDGGRAVIQAWLDGKGPYRLAVETGSPEVILSASLVSALALPPAG